MSNFTGFWFLAVGRHFEHITCITYVGAVMCLLFENDGTASGILTGGILSVTL